MKKTRISLLKYPFFYTLFLVAVAIVYNPVSADIKWTGLYTGLQFSDSTDEFKDAAGKEKENRGHIKGKLGKYLVKWLAVEVQFGMTTNSNSSRGIATYGAYLRPDLDLGQYKLYGLFGFSGIHAYEDNNEDVSETDLSYGLGLEIFGSKDLAVTFEYIKLIDDKSVNGGDLTFDTLGIGFTYYFTKDRSYFNKNRNRIRSIRY